MCLSPGEPAHEDKYLFGQSPAWDGRMFLGVVSEFEVVRGGPSPGGGVAVAAGLCVPSRWASVQRHRQPISGGDQRIDLGLP